VRRADLARRGRQRALSSFSWPVVARQHLDFFDRVIEARLRTPRGIAVEMTLNGAAAARLGADRLDEPRS
jgi:hypothetical protein